jgi:uncharacterized protein (TIGR03435 family)
MTRASASTRLSILFGFAVLAFGQTPVTSEPGPTDGVRFEVASVKPVLNWPPVAGASVRGAAGTGGGCPTTMRVDRERVDFNCVNLEMMIGYAFRLPPNRITGPDWMMAVGSPRFNIQAKLPQGASENQVPEMFQALLAERFKLTMHRGTGNLPVYALVVAKGGLKVTEAAPETGAATSPADPDAPPSLDGFYGNIQSRTIPSADGSSSTTTFSSPRMGTVRQSGDPYRVERWEASAISFGGLADLLENVAPLPLPVVDMTGLMGRYQMVLEVSLKDLPGARRRNSGGGEPIAADEDIGATVLRGFNDGLVKLGLRLELRKGPLATLVVDHVEKTPTKN